MAFSKVVSASALVAAASVGAASAGGFVAPVVETETVIAPVVVPSTWEGFYAGGSLGYALGGDDSVGADVYENGALTDRFSDITKLEVDGVNAGVHVGYRWQRNSWVFGPELWIEGGDISDSQSATVNDGPDVFSVGIESEVNYIVGLQMKTGYVVDPQTLIYGTVGYVHGDFDYTLSGTVNGQGGSLTDGYSADGYSLGLGVERKLSDSMAMFVEWQYRNFGKTDVSFGDQADSLVTRATPEHHNIKVGVNFQF